MFGRDKPTLLRWAIKGGPSKLEIKILINRSCFMLEPDKLSNVWIIVIKYKLLKSISYHTSAIAKNFPGYDHAICKNIRGSAPQIDMEF
jgi:hypothetical protein